MSKCRKIANKGNCARLHCNISSAQEYLMFILDVSEFLLSNINNFSEVKLSSSNIKLEDVVLCNQRLFCFVSKDKYFSINYPFEINGGSSLVHFRDCKLDLSSISHIKSSIDELFTGFQHKRFTLEESNNNASSVLTTKELRFVEQILSAETGYVRYDYDEKNENGRYHPLNHLDLNYNIGTFKIGFYRRLSPYEFMSILGSNQKDECAFIEHLFHKQWGKDLSVRIAKCVSTFLYNVMYRLK